METVSLPAILGRSRPALARAVTMFENDRPGADELHASLASHLGRAHVVGITGAPGAGKSTLIDALLGALVARGRSVAVVAVDPSSPVSGGAILGDRVRMGDAASHDDVFVRSLSSRGHLGGLSRAAGRVIDLFDAAGFDVVLVETVGTGQSEVEIREFADTKIVVCPPGLGDEVQSIKAGILEIADILLVNKADAPAAKRTYDDMRALSRLRRRPEWAVPVLRTVATSGEGIDELVEALGEHAKAMGKGSRLARRRAAGTAAVAGAGSANGASANGAMASGSSASDAAAQGPSPNCPSSGPKRAPAAHASDDELFEAMRAWRAAGKGVALATVVRTWGSSPRAEGSLLAVEQGGGFLGSVSGGCVEGAVISGALEVIADGKPRMLEFGVSDEQAWEVGLACGGKVQVYVERVG